MPPPFDEALLGVLACPATRTPLRYDAGAQELVADATGVAYPIRDGVPVLLLEEARPLAPPGRAGGERETVFDDRPELLEPRRFLDDAWRDLRASPAIGYRLFLSNLRVRNRRSRLGHLWLVIPALATTLAALYLQSRHVLGLPRTRAPYAVFVLAGTILWQAFVDALNVPLQQLTSGRQLITRTRVPHEALVLAGLMEVLLNAAVRTALLLVVLIPFGVPFGAAMLLAPAGITMLALLGLFLGLAVAPAGMLYDDVGRAILVATGFWFFLTPVVYPASGRGLLALNPVAPLLDTTRAWLLSQPHRAGFLVVTAATLAGLLLAWLFYRVARPHVVARLG